MLPNVSSLSIAKAQPATRIQPRERRARASRDRILAAADRENAQKKHHLKQMVGRRRRTVAERKAVTDKLLITNNSAL
jgi:hypothetical protein